jgi:hypothetical protein
MENTAQHIRLMVNAFQAQQIQINTLREQLAVTQEVLKSLYCAKIVSPFVFIIKAAENQFVPESGVLYQFDQQLTSFVNSITYPISLFGFSIFHFFTFSNFSLFHLNYFIVDLIFQKKFVCVE